ncbi:MAG: hypothetical protein ACI4TA_03230, partial [Acetatifactor sp.]
QLLSQTRKLALFKRFLPALSIAFTNSQARAFQALPACYRRRLLVNGATKPNAAFGVAWFCYALIISYFPEIEKDNYISNCPLFSVIVLIII